MSYLQSLQNKKLNEIVIPGSHDAGIYGPNIKGFSKTQNLNIYEQAQAGCRFFDLRIAVHKHYDKSNLQYEAQAYHADGAVLGSSKIWKSNQKKSRTNFTKYQTIRAGKGWGGSLDTMLVQARNFVQRNPTEFLILRISKSFNYNYIAQRCIKILDGFHYESGGNINHKFVSQLKGKVITVFDESARQLVTNPWKMAPGITFVKSLYDKDSKQFSAYDPNYEGLQYFGKYSNTKGKWSNNAKVNYNTKKQAQLMSQNAAAPIDVLGMMYWTSTGVSSNIEIRNGIMWNDINSQALKETWTQGLADAISDRLGKEEENFLKLKKQNDQMGGYLGGRMKAFMPNIVMMDFVAKDKCDIIKTLNDVAAVQLEKLYVKSYWEESMEGAF